MVLKQPCLQLVSSRWFLEEIVPLRHMQKRLRVFILVDIILEDWGEFLYCECIVVRGNTLTAIALSRQLNRRLCRIYYIQSRQIEGDDR
jgi:hypothetical protein